MLGRMDGTFDTVETDMRPVYDDFIHSVIALCTLPDDSDTPAYFTLNYTLLELQEYMTAANTEGAGKKSAHGIMPEQVYHISRHNSEMVGT